MLLLRAVRAIFLACSGLSVGTTVKCRSDTMVLVTDSTTLCSLNVTRSAVPYTFKPWYT